MITQSILKDCCFFTIQFTFCEHTNAVGWATGNIWPTNSLLNSHKGSHFVGHIQARSAVESGLVKQKLKVAYYCFCFLCLTCLFFRDPSMQRCPLPVVSVFGHDAEVVDSCLPCILHWLDWREWVWYPKDWTYPLLHEGSGLQYLVLRHQAADQDQTLQRVLYILLVLMYSADTWSITTVSSWRLYAFASVVSPAHSVYPIHRLHYQRRSRVQIQPTSSHFPYYIQKAVSVWSHRPSCPVTRSCVLCMWLSVVSKRTGVGGEIDVDGHGYAPLNLISSHTTLASARHGSMQRTNQNGLSLWRRLCSAKDMPPDDDSRLAGPLKVSKRKTIEDH